MLDTALAAVCGVLVGTAAVHIYRALRRKRVPKAEAAVVWPPEDTL
jgi:hypothetical protein